MIRGSIDKTVKCVKAGGQAVLFKWYGRHIRLLCDKRWQFLNSTQPQRFYLPLRIPKSIPFAAFRELKYKFYDLSNLSYEDRERISSMRIDIPCLYENLNLEYPDDRGDKNKPHKHKKNMIEDVNYRTSFQITACRDQKMTVSCPFSERKIATDCSFVVPFWGKYVFYRFSSTEVFYLITGFIWSGFCKIGFYFPSKEVIIGRHYLLGGFTGDNVVNMFKALMAANLSTVSAYIQNRKKSSAVWVGHTNFAHHLWNDLPAVEKALEKGLFDEISHLYVTQDTLGPLKSIFPEIPERLIRKIKNEKNLFRTVLRDQSFVVRIGSNFITQSVADRVLKLAKKSCSANIVERINKTRRDHYPLIWVSVRVRNRTWIRQEDGLARIISELFADYPRIGVVFDGFSVGYGNDVRAGTKTLIRELQGVVEKIRQRIPKGVAVYDTVGCGIHESIVWADAIDLYLCHHGTLQHKVGWIANKPGVVHTNSVTYLLPSNQVSKVTLARENAIQPIYIGAKYVTDIEIDYKDPTGFVKNLDNYNCDWQIMLRKLRSVLSNLRYIRSQPEGPPILPV